MVWGLLAVAAAAFNALGSVLQRRGAARVPDAQALRPRMVVTLVRTPSVLAGVAALAVGVALQAAALHGAPLSFVEPVLVAELPLTLLLAGLICGSHINRRAWCGIALTACALAGLLFSAQPSGGDAARTNGVAWIAAVVAGVGLCAVLVALATRTRGMRRAILLGLAGGAGHALAATLMKATTFAAAQGPAALFSAWQVYAMVAIGGGAVFVYQNALQAGPLIAAQPALAISEPAISIGYGVLLFGEHIRHGPWLAPEAVCVAALAFGVVVLSRGAAAESDERAGSRRDEVAERRGRARPAGRATRGAA